MEFLPILGLNKTWAAQQSVVAVVFMMRHTFSIGWPAGRPVKHMHSMPTKPRCCNLCCWNRHGVPEEKWSSWWQHMSLQNSNISLRINDTFTYMQISHAVGTDAPPYHHRGCFLWNQWSSVTYNLFSLVLRPFFVCCRRHILLFFIFTKYSENTETVFSVL